MNPRSAKKIALHFLFRVTLPVIKKKKNLQELHGMLRKEGCEKEMNCLAISP